MKCTVEDIPESELLRWKNLSDAERQTEFDLICKENSGALEELAAGKFFVAVGEDTTPTERSDVGLPLQRGREFVFPFAPIRPDEDNSAS